MPDPVRVHDPLADLRARLEATRAAAEQLAGEAAAAASASARGEEPPPGWHTDAERSRAAADASALADLLRTLAQIVPPELREQLTEVVRQILLLLRALLDWLVDRFAPAAPTGGPPGDEIPVG